MNIHTHTAGVEQLAATRGVSYGMFRLMSRRCRHNAVINLPRKEPKKRKEEESTPDISPAPTSHQEGT